MEETGLAIRVGALNPAWNEETSDAILDAKFEVASEMAGKVFLAKLTYLHKSWLPARDIVKQAMAQRFEVDKSGRILAAMEIPFSAEEIHSETLRVIEATAPNRSSMLQDHRRGDGRHELDYINLPLIRMGTAHGIEVEEHQLVYDRARRMLARPRLA